MEEEKKEIKKESKKRKQMREVNHRKKVEMKNLCHRNHR